MSINDGTVALKASRNVIPVGKWLDGHHIVHVDKDGVKHHVFAVGGHPVVGPQDFYQVDIGIPIGPIILKLQGFIDTTSLEADLTLYVKVPLLPDIQVGEAKGNLRDGITFEIGIPGIVTGSVTFYVTEDNWLRCKYTLTIFGVEYVADIALFKLPWL